MWDKEISFLTKMFTPSEISLSHMDTHEGFFHYFSYGMYFLYNFVSDSPANSPDRSVPATGVLNLSLIVPRNWNSSPSLAIA